MPIADRLAGKRMFLTGVTGFLGQALLERVLADLPETRLVLLVRSKDGVAARDRVAQLLTAPVFEPLRDRIGAEAVDAFLDERIEVVEGDVTGEPPSIPGDIDVVIHLAGSVEFDSPIDAAFRTNVVGVQRLYRSVQEAGGAPHVVHVSTAYVAGVTQGVIPESPLEHAVDWRAEADAASHARQHVERRSRESELLERLLDDARGENRKAGPKAVADDAERRRREWVDDHLVERGRKRAQSLGWPDVYTFTKALGERCAEEVCADLPLSVVRPSIIESALRHPRPGWIVGFKMAEPIILGFGRGALVEFPGIPDGVIDFIPVDLVVNALIAIAANPPQDSGHAYYHVCSGARNPLRFRTLYELVREYFVEHPIPDRDHGPVDPPRWEFPGTSRVMRLLRAGERLVEFADTAVEWLPRSERTRTLARRIYRRRRQVEFMRRYADLYGAYVDIEVIYTDDRTHRLLRSLDPDDQRRFPFDAAGFDWPHYLKDVHCPSVSASLREPQPRSRPSMTPADGLPSNGSAVAIFDLDGTVVATNVVESYLWLRMAEADGAGWVRHAGTLAWDAPRYLIAERRTREGFLRHFYRRYEGASLAALRRLVEDQVAELILQRASPQAIRRIRAHRSAGHRTILITGALDLLALPLAPLFDEIVAAELATDADGICTGILIRPPLVGEARSAWLRRYANRTGADLAASYAYADNHSDLPLLEAVGNPVAVNPDVHLFRRASSRRWPVERWDLAGGTPRVLLPARYVADGP
ncbi:MAG: HAD-IB family hydrolase [Actinobacteria bacterium]|nr:HAD-IB family hydrolase [Actinomycetota bacterium]